MARGWYLSVCLAAAACASADGSSDAGASDPADATAASPDGAAQGPDSGSIQIAADAAPEPQADAANPDPDPDAAPCAPAWTNLLDDGGFDSGATDWTAAGGPVIQDSTTMPISSYSGTHAAWLAGYNAANEELHQTVTVPADTSALRLTGYHCYVTADLGGANDFLHIRIRTGLGAELETLANISNEDVGTVCGWTSFELAPSSTHAGETIQLYFNATTDGLFPSSFYVDSLALEAYACP